MDDYLRDSVPIEKDVEGDEIHNNNIVYFCLFLVIVFFCITSCITCATPFQLKRTWEVILFFDAAEVVVIAIVYFCLILVMLSLLLPVTLCVCM